MGRRALEQLLEKVEQRAKSGLHPDNDQFDVDQSIRNGLNIFINFNANGNEDVFQAYEKPTSPESWMALRLLARGFYGMPAAVFVKEYSITQEEVNALDIRQIMGDLVDAHRSKRGLAASEPITVIVHLDEHQMLQADLIKYGAELFQGKQPDVSIAPCPGNFSKRRLLPFTDI